jgi:hypothetical protein
VLYCIVERINEEPGSCLPPGVAYQHLSYFSNFDASLYEVSLIDPSSIGYEEFRKSFTVLDTELTQLLNCARLYPPAWVLAVNSATVEAQTSEDFSIILTSRLKEALARQRNEPYFMARANDTDGEIIEGLYYWIIGYDVKSKQVHYISTDFQNYRNNATCFELPEELVIGLPA